MTPSFRGLIKVMAPLLLLALAGSVAFALRPSSPSAERALARSSALTEQRSFHAVFASEDWFAASNIGIRQTGSGDVSAGGMASELDSVNVSLGSSRKPQTIDSILSGGRLYWTTADLPLSTRLKPWLSSPAAQVGGESIVTTPDPADVLRLLQTPTADVSTEGLVMVGAEETRHYRFLLDLGTSPTQLDGAGIPPKMQVFVAPYLGNSIQADVYVTVSTDEIVRVSAVTSSTIREGATGTFSDSYSSYGEPLSIAAPPSDQVEPESALGPN